MTVRYKPSKIPTTIHIIGKTSKIMKEVYEQLEEDYPKDAIEWVLDAIWQGPVVVPLSTIDFSNQKNWQASKDTQHVDEFVKEISNDAFVKPVILVNERNNSKLLAIDGRHRLLAYKKLGLDPMAYIGTVDEVNGDYMYMHGKQFGSNNSSGGSSKGSSKGASKGKIKESKQASKAKK